MKDKKIHCKLCDFEGEALKQSKIHNGVKVMFFECPDCHHTIWSKTVEVSKNESAKDD